MNFNCARFKQNLFGYSARIVSFKIILNIIFRQKLLFPLRWHTHEYYFICLNWVLRCTFMLSTLWQSDHVRAQSQAGRTLRRGWVSSHHWWPITWKLVKLSEFGENRTDKQQRDYWRPLAWRDLDESCTKTSLGMRWMHVPNWTCVRHRMESSPFQKGLLFFGPYISSLCLLLLLCIGLKICHINWHKKKYMRS